MYGGSNYKIGFDGTVTPQEFRKIQENPALKKSFSQVKKGPSEQVPLPPQGQGQGQGSRPGQGPRPGQGTRPRPGPRPGQPLGNNTSNGQRLVTRKEGDFKFDYNRLGLPVTPGAPPPAVKLTEDEIQAFVDDGLDIGDIDCGNTHLNDNNPGAPPVSYCDYKKSLGHVLRFRDPRTDVGIMKQNENVGIKPTDSDINEMINEIKEINTKDKLLRGEMGLYAVAKDVTGLQKEIEDALEEAIEVQENFTEATTDPNVTTESKRVIKGMLPGISNAVTVLSDVKNKIGQQKMGANAAKGAAEAAFA
jgi:hypothetical protein